MFAISSLPWFADLANYKAVGVIPSDLTWQQKKKFLHDAKFFLWDDPLLFKRCADGMIRRCAPEEEFDSILWHCHGSSYGGHFSGERQQLRSYRVDSTGQPCSKMQESLWKDVIVVRGLEIFQGGMRCL